MKQKKGISLIVLVVVIIVMLIISGAVIISLTNSNVIDMGEQAVQKHNQKAVEEAINLAYQDLLVTNLGKVSGAEIVEKLETLSETYTEIQNVTAGNGKIYYTLSLTGKEYLIDTENGEIKEYVDNYGKVIGDSGLWKRNGTSIIGYTGTGEQLENVIVPNVLKDANGNEIKITTVSLGTIDFKGTLTISSGLYITYSSFKSCENIEKIIIGDNVTLEQGEAGTGSSFSYCTSLKEVIMGKNIKITNIGAAAYILCGCTALESVTIESLSEVGYRALKGPGKALKGNIIINEGVKTIGSEAFYGCENIKNIVMPSTIETIGGGAFEGCKTANINFPENIKTIASYAFYECSNMQTEVKIKSNASIGAKAFNKSGIKSIEIGNKINIPFESFKSCKNLEKIVIGNDVTIEYGEAGSGSAFSDCTSLKEVIMGENISFKSYGGAAKLFRNCMALEKVTIKSISLIGYSVFEMVGPALKGDIIINEDVQIIGSNAFKGCTNIENITLPSTLTTINSNAFNGCTGVNNFSVNMTSEAFANVTKGSGWNTGIPVEITYLQQATE